MQRVYRGIRHLIFVSLRHRTPVFGSGSHTLFLVKPLVLSAYRFVAFPRSILPQFSRGGVVALAWDVCLRLAGGPVSKGGNDGLLGTFERSQARVCGAA